MHTNRRSLVKGVAATALLAGLPMNFAFAAAPTEKRFIFVILRGGMDGLGVIVPYADPDYQEARGGPPNLDEFYDGGLAMPDPAERGGPIDLDGFFGLQPALEPLKAWYDEGSMMAVHAVASDYRDRSHFDGQDLLENGSGRVRGLHTGWLNRALGMMEQPDGRRNGLVMGLNTPLAMRGDVRVASWAPPTNPDPGKDFFERVERMYSEDPLLSAPLDEGLIAAEMAETAIGSGDAMSGMMMNANTPNSEVISSLAHAGGRLMAAPDGARIATFEMGGWDTHSQQGAFRGRLSANLEVFASAMLGMREGLGDAWSDTVIVAATEFGRTVHINGSAGTDHGTGGVALMFGGAIEGGRVLADWPGLSVTNQYEGRDLAPTTNTNSIFKAVLAEHIGLPIADINQHVFPNSADVRPMRDLVRV
ncbi:DUF1501 domain-containing protein [Parasphingopyxis sp.]|uniref:DUF1501 domain-containing protein n=1 Tax=Parasphingopyxis sp. TaxID=1920299 RepID=UPI002611130B|nr:DUF1501 domain-containing protein [Parasphingopyxis sp.]